MTEDDEMASAEIGFAIRQELEAMLEMLPKTALEWGKVPYSWHLEDVHWQLLSQNQLLKLLLKDKV